MFKEKLNKSPVKGSRFFPIKLQNLIEQGLFIEARSINYDFKIYHFRNNDKKMDLEL